MRWISAARLTQKACIALAGIALVLFVSRTSVAAPPRAEELFDSARGDMKRGDFAAARAKLVESLQLEETVGTLFNLALCEEKLQRIQSSLEHLRAALARASDDDRRRPTITALIASLEGRIARIILKRATDDTAELRITLDGRPVEASPDGREVLVDPGEHHLEVRRGQDGPERSTSIHVDEGASVVHVVVASPGPPPVTTAPAPTSLLTALPAASGGGLFRRRSSAVAVTVGGAALIAGVVLRFMAYGSKISMNHHCTAAGCDDEGRRAAADDASYADASTALAISGIAAVGLGSYGLLGPGVAQPRPAPGLSRTVGTVAGSVGTLALVASAIAGGVALAAKRDLLDRCGDAGPCSDQRGLNAAATGRTAATVATVGLGVGVAGLGLWSYLLVLRPSFLPSLGLHLAVTPSGMAWVGRF
jgi:hypothetical protein